MEASWAILAALVASQVCLGSHLGHIGRVGERQGRVWAPTEPREEGTLHASPPLFEALSAPRHAPGALQGVQDALDGFQDGPGRPPKPPRWPKMPPRRPKMHPRRLKMASRWPKTAQEAPKRPPRRPKKLPRPPDFDSCSLLKPLDFDFCSFLDYYYSYFLEHLLG